MRGGIAVEHISQPGEQLVVLTRRQALLDLVGLVRVLEDQGVEVSMASDLQLDVLGLD